MLLQINTYAMLHEWKILQAENNEMKDIDESFEGWIDVQGRGRRRNASPPATADRHQDLPNPQKQQEIPARQAIKELHNQRKQLKRYKKTMKPASKLPKVSTV
ncbi:hypothetical protein MHU86_8036 [Fragilaria crotonensis]|nr:hypothetical protein MHU86_8036 [Fragilaria crotonensis]